MAKKTDRPRPLAERRPPGSRSARLRFGLSGFTLALAIGVGAPEIARGLGRSWGLPTEAIQIGLALVVGAVFFAIGWRLGRRVEVLTDQAHHDPVTHIGNRRHWEACLRREVASAHAAHMPLSLLMIDVDHLKELNDQGGHVAGDTAIKIVGSALRDTCRSRDVAARFGGDELALLLPRTRAVEAEVVADRVRSSIVERRGGLGAPLDRLTISIGIAELDAAPEPSADELFKAADRALYVAKNSGRDRVVVYRRELDSQPPRRDSVIQLDARRRRGSRRRVRSVGGGTA